MGPKQALFKTVNRFVLQLELFRVKVGRVSGKTRSEPSRRKKMRYLSHFSLSAKAGLPGKNTQPMQGIIWLSNLMILNKIKN